ncbi:hypothetical protein COE51_10840 [Bacillus pseudomycoides]|nr:hypothetical protein COE51_10840 [Bacillus pseudomycoides]
MKLTFKTYLLQFKSNGSLFGATLETFHDSLPNFDEWCEIKDCIPHGWKGFVYRVYKSYLNKYNDLSLLYDQGFLDDQALNKLGITENWVYLNNGDKVQGVAAKNEDGSFKCDHVAFEKTKTHYIGWYMKGGDR